MKKIILIVFIIQTSIQFVEAQWIQQNSGTNQNLYDIEFINDKTGWAVGDAGVVIKTTNGGMNWLNVPNPSGQYGGLMWSICPVDSEVVYAVAGYDFIMKSTNGGLNWNVLSGRPGSISAFKGLYFLNIDTGWFVGTYKVFRTYDGGNTLDSFYAPWFTNYDIYFKDINSGIFCGSGRVFKSTNGGMNWFDTNVPVGGMFYEFRKLAVFDDNVWVVGSSSPVFRSTNFCETWEIITPGQQIGGIGIHFINQNTGYIGRSLNNLIKTTNSGYNWYEQRTDSTSLAFISSITFANDTVGWYSCGVGKIFKTITAGQWLTNVTSYSNQTPNKFSLSQNYPNPFNPQTKIEYSIPKDDFVTVKIYNLLGREVMILENEYKKSGSYKITFDGANLSSGVYYYKISSGKFEQVKKMILIK